jgi:hypothetical protein
MSTTTSGPFTRVVLRMMPSGSVKSVEVRGGVVHPWTHVGDGAPRVGGGFFGMAGGVGVAVGDGLSEVEADPEAPRRAACRDAHADSTAAVTRSRQILSRNGRSPSIPNADEHTHGHLPW